MARNEPFTPEESACRIAGLVLLNAMMFQEVLASHDHRVLPLAKVISKPNPIQAFCDHWSYIVNDINYYSIFHLAQEVGEDLTSDADIAERVTDFARTAQQIVSMRAALRHDLVGRIYHRLLVEAKYLGTYYTGIPAATLLLALTLRPEAWAVDWSDLQEVTDLRIGDLACGTGTLLMAAADTVTDNYVNTAAGRGVTPDVAGLQKGLVEEVLHGYDVLSSAVHLTASTLALRAPEVAFEGMNLWAMPLGGHDNRLGSLEFLANGTVQGRLWGALGQAKRVRGKGTEGTVTTLVPPLDVCVMNPPFTRSVGGNLLFGSLPDEERGPLQARLKEVVGSETVSANITAGLGSVFVAAGNKYVKPGGRLALVLPHSLVSGVAWGKTRDLLARDYHVEYLVSSHDPEHWNFSENTSLSEVLVVARRIPQRLKANGATEENSGQGPPARTVSVNLWRNPTTSFEALAVAEQLIDGSPPDLDSGQSALRLHLGQTKLGEAISVDWKSLKRAANWMLPCAFAQADLMRTALHLVEGKVWLPGEGNVGALPLCPLRKLGVLGPDRRDIFDGFEVSSAPTNFAAFWGHRAEDVRTIAQTPNAYLAELANPRQGRPLRKATVLWPRAGQLLLAERMRLNTQAATAVFLPRRVLSNVWWPFAFHRDLRTDEFETVTALWLNSTFALILLLTQRQETQGAWVDFKKPTLAALPVLDVRAIGGDKMALLLATYKGVCGSTLAPLARLNTDPVRAAIDKAIGDAFHLPPCDDLREMLAREPIMSLRALGT